MNQSLSGDLRRRVARFYRDIDSNDREAFSRWLTGDAVFVFNDTDPATGPAAIDDFVSTWKAGFTSVTHQIVATVVDGENACVAVELIVRYAFHSGREVTLRGCSFLDFADDLISGWRVYLDTTRLS